MDHGRQYTDWSKFAPLLITIPSFITLMMIGLFLNANITWFKSTVFDSAIYDVNTPGYRIYAHQLHLSMVKRSIGLFSGFAIMFLGMGVSFYSLKDVTTIDGQGSGISMKLVTTSPGIIALIVGAYLILSTIKSKDIFPLYNDGSLQEIEQPLDTTKIPDFPNQ
jgi:hypothetical protein